MIDVRPTGRPTGQTSACGKNVNVAIFSNTINMINVKHCMVVVLTELYPFIPLSMNLLNTAAVSHSFN